MDNPLMAMIRDGMQNVITSLGADRDKVTAYNRFVPCCQVPDGNF